MDFSRIAGRDDVGRRRVRPLGWIENFVDLNYDGNLGGPLRD